MWIFNSNIKEKCKKFVHHEKSPQLRRWNSSPSLIELSSGVIGSVVDLLGPVSIYSQIRKADKSANRSHPQPTTNRRWFISKGIHKVATSRSTEVLLTNEKAEKSWLSSDVSLGSYKSCTNSGAARKSSKTVSVN